MTPNRKDMSKRVLTALSPALSLSLSLSSLNRELLAFCSLFAYLPHVVRTNSFLFPNKSKWEISFLYALRGNCYQASKTELFINCVSYKSCSSARVLANSWTVNILIYLIFSFLSQQAARKNARVAGKMTKMWRASVGCENCSKTECGICRKAYEPAPITPWPTPFPPASH